MLFPAAISPRRPVPATIARPEYVDRPAPAPYDGAEVKDAETIERMRRAGRLAAEALQEVGRHVAPGVTTDELDRVGHEFLCDRGAYPSTLGYRGFPSRCAPRVNEVICHGIPDARADRGRRHRQRRHHRVPRRRPRRHQRHLPHRPACRRRHACSVERTQEALRRAISAVKPGRRMSVVGRVIEAYAARFGYGVVREFTGHGIGTAFHSGLVVAHYDDPAYDDPIEVGMTFTIEPMLCLGTTEWDMWPDGWTVTTRDGRASAQFEHTLLVTPDGAEVLTTADPQGA